MDNNSVGKRSLWKKILIWLIIVIALLFVAGFTLSKIKPPKKGADQESKIPGPGFLTRNDNCKSNKNPLFTANFTDLERIKFLAPIGAVNAGSPGRAYVFANDPASGGSRELIPVYSPVDATLEGIVYARRNPNDPNAPGEYRLDFKVSCEVTFHLDHLDDVVPEIKNIAPSEPADNTRNAKQVSLQVKAGQLVAHTNGTDQSGGFDFFLINKSKEVSHINQKRWNWDQTKYADCPYDYFKEDLKNKYYGMLKSHDNQKLLVQSCGSPSHDIVGTASGGWFQGDSSDQQGNWLEIANANGKTELLVRNSGNHAFVIRDYNAKVLPDKLTIGNSTCYSETNKWAYVKVDSDSKILMAKGEGSCPAAFPSASAEIWER